MNHDRHGVPASGRIYLLLIALVVALSCGVVSTGPVLATSIHADFNSAGVIDNGFSTSKGGSGTDNVTGTVMQLRSPAGTDSALLRMDTALDNTKTWTIDVAITPITSSSTQYGWDGLTTQRRATSPPVVVSSSNDNGFAYGPHIALSPYQGQWLITYKHQTAGNDYYWTGAAWDTTPAWYNGITASTKYLLRMESADQGGMSWRLSILLYSDNSVVTQTSWVSWGNVYYDRTDPLWLLVGERYTDLAVMSADVDYVHYDEAGGGVAPGAVQNLALTPSVNSMLIEWDAPTTGDLPTGYYVYRSTDSGSSWSTAIATLDNTTLSFTDHWRASASYDLFGVTEPRLGLRHATRYDYKVIAYNSTGNSPDATANDNTTSPTPASGANRGKHLVGLIIQSTDAHAGGDAPDPSVAQITTAHDWIRANVTTKITLFLSMEILTATSGAPLDVLNYVDNLVDTYGYDIATIPHKAWLPTVSPYSQGIATEQARMQSAHDNVFAKWGKYPVFAAAWSYNNDLIEKAIALGYQVAPSVVNDDYGIDGYTSLGTFPGLYRPSKRNTAMAGDGTPANTYDIVAGFQMIQRAPAFSEVAATGGSQYAGMYSIGVSDIPNDFVQGKQSITDLANSTNQNARPWYVMDYWDPYWMFIDAHGGATIGSDHENVFAEKNIALWEKAYLHPASNPIADYVTATEFATWADSAIRTPTDAQFVLGTHQIIGETGTVPPIPGDQMAWYGSRTFASKIRWRTGAGGHVRMVDYIPYSATNDEPTPPASNWSVTSGVIRNAGTAPLTVKLHLGSDNVTISGATAGDNVANVHAPTYSVLGNNAVIAWDIYNTANTERLTHFYLKFREGGFCWGHSSDRASLTVTATGFVSGQACASETLRRYIQTR